jgi:hypothetical protein
MPSYMDTENNVIVAAHIREHPGLCSAEADKRRPRNRVNLASGLCVCPLTVADT